MTTLLFECIIRVGGAEGEVKLRNKLGLALWILLLLFDLPKVALAQSSDHCVVSLEMPAYPALARQSRVRGSVTVEIEVDDNGSVTSAKTVDGHPLLREAATKNARTWKFRAGDPFKHTVVFDFKMRDEPSIGRCVRVTFDSYQRVEITTDPPITDTTY